ncbi:MAG: D-aminoacylase [Acidimicrobiia bacterium]|nr:MAG: D-aminoacylase [Acidimicrobiia bacterium]
MTADIVFRGGLVADGTGRSVFAADVAVTGDKIVAVTEPGAARGVRIVDIDGLVVAPGFVDMHSHSDLAVLTDPLHEAKVMQGVTLEVIGQDGLAYAPVSSETLAQLRVQLAGWHGDPESADWSWRTVGEFLDRVDAVTPVNVAYLVPHGNVRLLVMGDSDQPPSSGELAEMKQIVEDGLAEGAFGMSTGLTYVPAAFAETNELIELCRSVATSGGFFSPHHRNYGAEIFAGYQECIDIAEASDVALHFAHAHVNFPRNDGKARELLDMIDVAVGKGIDVTFDTYPYTAGATYLHALMPSWTLKAGVDAMREFLSDATTRSRILRELEIDGSDGHHGMPVEWHTIFLSGASTEGFGAFSGSSVTEIAAILGRPPGDMYLDIVEAEGFGASCIVDIGNEANVRTIMTHASHTAGSDGILVGRRPHPRGWGTFPRYLAKYVRELGVLSLEECVKHFTSNATHRLGISDRGVLSLGTRADLVCFSPTDVQDRATMESPRTSPAGIPYVMINGEFAVEEGRRTASSSGRALRSHDERLVPGALHKDKYRGDSV